MTSKTDNKPMLAKMALVITVAAGALTLATPAQSANPKVVKLSAPQTRLSIRLGPHDPPIEVTADSSNPWYCDTEYGIGLRLYSVLVDSYWRDIKSDPSSKKENAKWLGSIADDFIKYENKDAFEFWDANKKNMFIVEPASVTLNPPQGQKVSKSISSCYSMAELVAGQRETLRWAHYMKNIWLPANKGGN